MKTIFIIFLFICYNIFSQTPEFILPAQHANFISEITESGNGKFIVTAAADNTIKVWEANSARLLRTYRNKYNYVSITNNGDFMTAESSTTCTLWNLLNNSIIKIPSEILPQKITLSNNSKYAAALFDDSLNLYNLNPFTLIKSFHIKCNAYCSPKFSDDGSKLIFSTVNDNYQNDIVVINTNDFNEKVLHLSIHVSDIKYSSGNFCLASYYDKAYDINLQTGNIVFNTSITNSITAYAISADDKSIALITPDSVLQIYNSETGKIIKAHTAAVNKINLSNALPEVMLLSSDSVAIWNWEKDEIISSYKAPYLSFISAAIFLKDTGKIALALNNTSSHLLITANKSFAAESFRQFGEKIKNIDFEVFDPTSAKIYSTMFTPGELHDDKVLSLTSGKLITRLQPTDWVINPFTPDGKYIFQYRKMYSNQPVCLLNAADGTVAQSLDTYSPDYGIYSADRKYYFIPEFNAVEMFIRDGSFLKKLHPLSPSPGNVLLNAAFNNNSSLLAVSWQNKLYLYNTASGKLKYTLSLKDGDVLSIFFTKNNNRLITGSSLGDVIIWDAASGNMINSFKNFLPAGSFIDSSAIVDEDVIIKETDDGKSLEGENFTNGKIQFKISGEHIILKYEMLPYEKKIAVVYYDNDSLFLYNSNDGTLAGTLTGHFTSVTSLKENNASILIAGFANGNVEFWNLNTLKLLHAEFAHSAPVNKIIISPNNRLASTVSDDCTSKLWDVASGRLMFTFVSIDSSYLILSPENFYMGEASVVKKLYFENKLKTISFSQLDIKYNRPDKVLQALGNTDTALITSYEKAYEKRIKKLGIDTSSFKQGFAAPEADFTNRDNVEYEQTNKILKLNIHGTDSTDTLDRFNIWINDVPLFGLKGISIRYKNKNVFDTAVTVILSQGDNKIETSVINVNGIESYRSPLYIKYSPAQPEKEKTYFLGIGIDKFADAEYNLQWSTKDVRDLAIHLKEKYKDAIEIDTLFNEDVTVNSVTALKQKLEQTSVNDKVIVDYSGHGLLSSDYDYYLSTYNINFHQPEQNGLPYDALENLLDSIPARKKLMLIDACHSGEIDKDEMQQYTKIKSKLDSADIQVSKGKKGVELENTDSSKIGMKNSFELMQQLFVNVGKSTGATIISAAAGTQFALEKSNLKNGVFTYSILEYMQQHEHANLSALKQYVNTRVPELTQGLQQPTSRSETIDVDWNVW